MLPPDRKPDAVIVPTDRYSAGRFGSSAIAAGESQKRIRQEFGSRIVLNNQGLVYVRSQTNQYFCTGSPHCTLLFPVGHPFAKQERYEWYVINEGKGEKDLSEPRLVNCWRDEPGTVKFGWKKADPYDLSDQLVGQPTTTVASDSTALDAYGPSYSRMMTLRAKGITASPTEVEELTRIDAAASERMNSTKEIKNE